MCQKSFLKPCASVTRERSHLQTCVSCNSLKSHTVKNRRSTPILLLNLISHQPLHCSLRRRRNCIRFRHLIVLCTLPQKGLHIPPATRRNSHISSRQRHTPTCQLSCLSGPKVRIQVSIPHWLCQRRRLSILDRLNIACTSESLLYSRPRKASLCLCACARFDHHT